MDQQVDKNFRFNYIMNVFDGGFFGMGVGFASFASVIPLFFSTMTDSAILIGLIPAIHNIGWQLPQLVMANRISRLQHYKPLTLFLTIQERLPYLGLGILAYFLGRIGDQTGLFIGFLLLIWQGLGAGLTANPWLNLIGRVIPGIYRATFFGVQSAASNLLASISAIAAGYMLARFPEPLNFAACFASASVCMVVSWFFIAQTREPYRSVEEIPQLEQPFWQNVLSILRRDVNFRWFLVSRWLSQFGMMAGAFYTVYAVRYLGMSKMTTGILTSVLLVTQVLANPVLGWIADRWSRKQVLALGLLANGLSGLLAFLAPSLNWFYPVIILFGIGNTAYWTIGMALSMEFGTEAERPTYIGMSSTLVAPATIAAPLVGGLLADTAGYQIAFFVSAVAALGTFWLLLKAVHDPQPVC